MPKQIFDLTVQTNTEDEILKDKSPHSTDFPPDIFEQRHIGGEFKVIKFGLDANLPDGTTRTKAYFAYDTYKLYLWSKTAEAWKSVTLS